MGVLQACLHIFTCQSWIFGEQSFYRVTRTQKLEQRVNRNSGSPNRWTSVTDVRVNLTLAVSRKVLEVVSRWTPKVIWVDGAAQLAKLAFGVALYTGQKFT